jgi:AbrB family looped-hinge helix DNA binding protein
MRAKISSKGQLVLPKDLRERRGMVEGAEVDVEEVQEGVLLKLVRGPEGASLGDLVGCTGYRGGRKSLEDMEAAVRKNARARR